MKRLIAAALILAAQSTLAADTTAVKFTAEVATTINILRVDAYNPRNEGGYGYAVIQYEMKQDCPRSFALFGDNMSADGFNLGMFQVGGGHNRVRVGDKFEDRITSLVYKKSHYLVLNKVYCS